MGKCVMCASNADNADDDDDDDGDRDLLPLNGVPVLCWWVRVKAPILIIALYFLILQELHGV